MCQLRRQLAWSGHSQHCSNRRASESSPRGQGVTSANFLEQVQRHERVEQGHHARGSHSSLAAVSSAVTPRSEGGEGSDRRRPPGRRRLITPAQFEQLVGVHGLTGSCFITTIPLRWLISGQDSADQENGAKCLVENDWRSREEQRKGLGK